MITSDTTLEELLDLAVNTLNELVQPNEEFLVKDLFVGVEWERISRVNRVKLGGLFNYYADTKGSGVEKVRKNQRNQWIYKKLK